MIAATYKKLPSWPIVAASVTWDGLAEVLASLFKFFSLVYLNTYSEFTRLFITQNIYLCCPYSGPDKLAE